MYNTCMFQGLNLTVELPYSSIPDQTEVSGSVLIISFKRLSLTVRSSLFQVS